MSESDIEAGARWGEQIQRQLSETRFGIICVSKTNVASPWLLFEAGALAKTLEDTYVCPYLIGMEPSELPQGPLAQFQAKRANMSETRDLLEAINTALGDQGLTSERLEKGFGRWWPDLESRLDNLPHQDDATPPLARKPEEMLEEILLLVRKIERQERTDSRLVTERRSADATRALYNFLAHRRGEPESRFHIDLDRSRSPILRIAEPTAMSRDQLKDLYINLRDLLASYPDEEAWRLQRTKLDQPESDDESS